jgi:hypothetical protein
MTGCWWAPKPATTFLHGRDISATRTTTDTGNGEVDMQFNHMIPLDGRMTCCFRFVATPQRKNYE